MVSEDERRRVAAALRGLTSNVYGLRKSYESEGFSILCEEQADYYQMCKAVCGYLPPEHMHPCDYKELHDCLADLIEPSGNVKCVAEVKVDGEKLKKLVHDAVSEYAGVDRGALLALADELETDGVDCYSVSTQYVCDQYARRIREACGEAVS